MKHSKLALMLALPIAIAALLSSLLTQVRTESQSQPSEYPAPESWVAFSAKMTIQDPDGTVIVGSFYRNQEGSTHLVTRLNGKGPLVFSVKNIPQATFYTNNTDGTWTAAPMELPEGGWLPPRYRVANKAVSKFHHRLDIEAGGSQSFAAARGLEAITFTNAGGTATLLVPELNFFPVLRTLVNGRRQSYTEIRKGVPPDHLFGPPSDVEVKRVDTPMGITREPEVRVHEH